MFQNKNKRSRILNSTTYKVLLLRPISSRQNILNYNSFLKNMIKKCIISDERFNSALIIIEYGDENCNSKSNTKQIPSVFLRIYSMFLLNRPGYSSSVWRKLFWMIILFLCTGCCISHIYQFLSAYYAYPVIVNIETISAEFLEFPAVTICNMNEIRNEFQDCAENWINYNKCMNLSKLDKTLIGLENITIPPCLNIAIYIN